MITLTVITLSGVHCSAFSQYNYNFNFNYNYNYNYRIAEQFTRSWRVPGSRFPDTRSLTETPKILLVSYPFKQKQTQITL